MPQGLPGSQSQVCACPGCDEIVVQVDPGSPRLYHSRECRKKARHIRHHTDTAGATPPPPAAALPDYPQAAEHADAAEHPQPAARADALKDADADRDAARHSDADRDAAGHFDADRDAAGHFDADAAAGSGDSGFWEPDDADVGGFWDDSRRPALNGARSPGRHRSPANPLRARRFRVAAAVVALAAGVVALGLFGSQPGRHRPLPASGAQLPAPGAVTGPPSASSSPAQVRHARTRPGPGRSSSSASPTTRPPTTSSSPAPPRTSSPKPSRSATPTPAPSPSRSPVRRPPRGLVSFEQGTDGWGTYWGHITASRTTRVAYSGTHALLITTSGSTYSAVGVDDGPVTQLHSGDKVTFHIWSSGQDASIQPFVQDDAFKPYKVGSVQLPSRGWFTLPWTIPSVSSVNAIGLQLTNPGTSRITIAIDALTWPGS